MKKLLIFLLFLGLLTYILSMSTPERDLLSNKEKDGVRTSSEKRIVEVAHDVLVTVYVGEPEWEEALEKNKRLKNRRSFNANKSYEKRTHDIDPKVMDDMPGYIQKFEKFAQAKYADVDFHGQFIDQNGEPIPDITIKFSLSLPQMLGGWKSQKVYSRTDSNGKFHLTGISGEFFTIAGINKLGYFFKGVREDFGYSRNNVSTDFENPYVFTGWKIDDESLSADRNNIKRWEVTARNERILPSTSFSVFANFEEKKPSFNKGANGDISVLVNRVYDSKDERLSYDFTLSFKNGGLILQDDQYPYLAPVDGYISTFRVSKSREDDDWKSGEYSENFYFKHDNKYGLVRLNVRPFIRKEFVVVNLGGDVNVSGSRNLLTKSEINKVRKTFDPSSGKRLWENR